jgi:hypothetical protein
MLKTITNVANSLLNTVSGQSNQYSASKELQNAKDIQKMYSDAINTQYAAGIQNLQNQDKTLALQYDPQRALVNSNYERGVRNNEEQMANLGLTRSGTNLTAQLALESERQRGLAEVNSAQDAARRELQAQINEYIAQRDSAIAQQSASIYQNAYDNISEYQRQLAQMEKQHRYDKEMASISHGYDKELAAIDNGYKQEMAKLEYEHSLALANNNYDREAEIKREMAALEQEYAMAKLNRQAELDRQNYSSKAATDWNYYQKQAALDSQYDIALANAKKAAEDETSSDEVESVGSDMLGNIILDAVSSYGWNPQTKKFSTEADSKEFKTQLDYWVNEKAISRNDYLYLLETLNY